MKLQAAKVGAFGSKLIAAVWGKIEACENFCAFPRVEQVPWDQP